MTPKEGDHLEVTTDEGTQSVRVQDVTDIGIHERADGSRSHRFSVILEGGLEVVLHDSTYEFFSEKRQFPMDVRPFGPEDGRSQLYEAVLDVDDPSKS